MKKIALLTLFAVSSLSVFAQGDSLIFFFMGNVKGDKFEVFCKGKLILRFKGSGSYKYSYDVPKEASWWDGSDESQIAIFLKTVAITEGRFLGQENP